MMNNINTIISQPDIQQHSVAPTVKSENNTFQPTVSASSAIAYSSNASPSTIVNISSEAQKKLAEEQNAIGKELVKQAQFKETKQTEEVSKTDTEHFDKLIENIQEKIKEVQQEIRALNGEKTEDAQAKRKALESQLVSLNVTLIGLLGKKMEALEG